MVAGPSLPRIGTLRCRWRGNHRSFEDDARCFFGGLTLAANCRLNDRIDLQNVCSPASSDPVLEEALHYRSVRPRRYRAETDTAGPLKTYASRSRTISRMRILLRQMPTAHPLDRQQCTLVSATSRIAPWRMRRRRARVRGFELRLRCVRLPLKRRLVR